MLAPIKLKTFDCIIQALSTLSKRLSLTNPCFIYYVNQINKTSEGSQSTQIGDAFSYHAALTYRLNGGSHALHNHRHAGETQWDLIVELNGNKRRRNKVSGQSEEHSGGNIVFLSPGIKVSSGKLGGFLSVSVPVIEDNNGTQTDIEMRILSGISIAF
ncbi:MAG: hypothetical protein RPT25_14840 [Cycloclasticus sp.]